MVPFFVRTLGGSTSTISAEISHTVGDVKQQLQARNGVPVADQILMYCGRVLEDSTSLATLGMGRDATLHQTSRLRGGKPVTVKIMTNHLPCGPEVTIDIESNASKDDIKAKLAQATGVPVEHQKVMLSGINQIVMGDKRTNIGYASCGSSIGVQMAVGQ